jgi:hypothetical protein
MSFVCLIDISVLLFVENDDSDDRDAAEWLCGADEPEIVSTEQVFEGEEEEDYAEEDDNMSYIGSDVESPLQSRVTSFARNIDTEEFDSDEDFSKLQPLLIDERETQAVVEMDPAVLLQMTRDNDEDEQEEAEEVII